MVIAITCSKLLLKEKLKMFYSVCTGYVNQGTKTFAKKPKFGKLLREIYLSFRTTKIKETTLTLTVILSRMKQFFNFFSVTNIRQKSCRVSVPLKIYNSLCKSKRKQELSAAY